MRIYQIKHLQLQLLLLLGFCKIYLFKTANHHIFKQFITILLAKPLETVSWCILLVVIKR